MRDRVNTLRRMSVQPGSIESFLATVPGGEQLAGTTQKDGAGGEMLADAPAEAEAEAPAEAQAEAEAPAEGAAEAPATAARASPAAAACDGEGPTLPVAENPFVVSSLCIRDALEGRDKSGWFTLRNRPKGERWAFRLQTNKWWGRGYMFLILAQSLVILYEEQSLAAGVAVSATAVGFFCADCALKIHYMTFKTFIFKRWNYIQVGFIVLFAVDLILYITGTFQPFRCLRPWMVLCRERELRRVFQAISAMTWKLLVVLGYTCVFILMFACIGVRLFADVYQSQCDTGGVDYNGAFDDPVIAFIRMFVLVTTENYPDIMMPAYNHNKASFVFFALFLVIGVFYILPMLLAVVMDSYLSATGKQVKKDRKKERKKLIEAFNFLDPEGEGFIGMETWLQLMEVGEGEMA